MIFTTLFNYSLLLFLVQSLHFRLAFIFYAKSAGLVTKNYTKTWLAIICANIINIGTVKSEKIVVATTDAEASSASAFVIAAKSTVDVAAGVQL